MPVERAVASIPMTFVVVALVVTHVIPGVLLTLRIGAHWSARHGEFVLAVRPREVHGAAAAVLVRVGRVFDAGASILAVPRTPLFVLTVRSAEARLALAVQVAG